MQPEKTIRNVLCYGDSNTWGQIPRSPSRFSRGIRWPYVLDDNLGDNFKIISDGLPGRTIYCNDSQLNGLNNLPEVLNTHAPIDTVIIMLGTNDLKNEYNFLPKDIAINLGRMVNVIQEQVVQNIIIVCPPPIIKPEIEAKSEEGRKLDETMARAIELSTELSSLYQEVAWRYKCGFINAGDYISSSKKDGYHMDADAHAKLAEVLEKELLKIHKE